MIVWYLQSTNIVLIREDHTDKIVLGFVLPTFLLEIYLLESLRENQIGSVDSKSFVPDKGR